MSLARVDARRCRRARLFLSSSPDPLDLAAAPPPGADPDADLAPIAERLEASDLTANPNAVLLRALHDPDPAADPRDVILLTHARSGRDPATYASGVRRATDRVFTVTVDDSGAAELGEWVGTGLVPLRSFRVDLAAAEAARPEADAPPAGPTAGPGFDAREWTGDVEPVPFPFRPGLVAEPVQFGFDADGEWLVVVGRDGVLHGLTLDGSPPEVLPRAYRLGSALKDVDAILGVTGGVVVCGRMAASAEPQRGGGASGRGTPVLSSGASAPPEESAVAAHYDLAARRVALHFLGPVIPNARWTAHPDLHCVVNRTPDGEGCALDLATLGRFPQPGPVSMKLVSRAHLAWNTAPKGSPPLDVPIYADPPQPDAPGPGLFQSGAALHVLLPSGARRTVTPLRDGKPLLAGATLHGGQVAGDVLALDYTSARERRLLLLNAADGAVLGDVAGPVRHTFTLSPNGRSLARREVARAVTVARTGDPGRVVATGGPATLHDALAVHLEVPFRLTVTIGGYRHSFTTGGGELKYKARWETTDRPTPTKALVALPAITHDAARFPPAAVAHAPGWWAVVDRLGQVLLFRAGRGAAVAAFLVRRERAAAWAPGGAFWGDAKLIGGPATPDAGRAIARAIHAAEGG